MSSLLQPLLLPHISRLLRTGALEPVTAKPKYSPLAHVRKLSHAEEWQELLYGSSVLSLSYRTFKRPCFALIRRIAAEGDPRRLVFSNLNFQSPLHKRPEILSP